MPRGLRVLSGRHQKTFYLLPICSDSNRASNVFAFRRRLFCRAWLPASVLGQGGTVQINFRMRSASHGLWRPRTTKVMRRKKPMKKRLWLALRRPTHSQGDYLHLKNHFCRSPHRFRTPTASAPQSVTGHETDRSDWLLCICTGQRFDGVLRPVECGHRQLAARGKKLVSCLEGCRLWVPGQAALAPQPMPAAPVPDSVSALVRHRT